MAALDLLSVAIDRLEAYKETLDLVHAVPFTTAVFDIGDNLPEERGGLFALGAEVHASRIIYFYLRREGAARRAEVLKQSIQETLGLFLPVYMVSMEDKGTADEALGLIPPDAVAAFRELAVGKIRRAAEDGSLTRHKRLGYILHRWRDWAGEAEAKAWSEAIAATPEGTLDLLAAFVGPTRIWSLGDRVGRTNWTVNLEGLEPFLSPEVVEQRLSTIREETLSANHKRAVQAFRAALQAQRESKKGSNQEG